jgi:hypothetical protein
MANDDTEILGPKRPSEPLDRRRELFLRDFFENPELYTFGIITQKGYRDLEDQLTKHANAVQARFHRWLVFGLIAFSIIALTSAAGLVGFGVLLKKQGNTTAEIQRQRHDTIERNCKDQNERHDRTARALNRAVVVAVRKAKTQKLKRAIRENSEVSLGLIDLLAPKQDCEAIVREATR